ncbi:hypothetical protein AE02_04767 [Klebsiella variicola]|nr:type IV toxin-antitoxin system AbiEi family antitoxin domain-containing protein [Klebsiella variicola]KDL92868.1 hypothetical protein AE02_04767 [Klebsiella variicola]
MDIQAPYYRQVALLMQVLPYVAVEREFALKGGTAINLFIRDFPRLSVDIDLAWVPLGMSMENKALLPKWFREFPGVEWIVISGQKLPVLDDKYRVTLDVKGKRLTGSAPELAAYELLSAVPGTLSFNHAAELFQGLVNLNPRKVEYLLSVSQSVQTKRLYLFFASFYEHGWLRRIDSQKIDLGAGKRQIVVNGKFNAQYQITVPERFQKE